MEYSFALGAAADANGLVAQEYDGGSIDWYTFDRATSPLAGGAAQPASLSRTVTVAPVTFRGMPARRFWQIEDAAVNIGALDAAASDIGRLLLREFALTYGNDWFQILLALPVGCQATINALSVTDTFGLATTIPHYAAVDGVPGHWRLFALDDAGPTITSANSALTEANLLVLTPGGVAILDSDPIEDVLLLRGRTRRNGLGNRAQGRRALRLAARPRACLAHRAAACPAAFQRRDSRLPPGLDRARLLDTVSARRGG